jgi:hypothetical protein
MPPMSSGGAFSLGRSDSEKIRRSNGFRGIAAGVCLIHQQRSYVPGAGERRVTVICPSRHRQCCGLQRNLGRHLSGTIHPPNYAWPRPAPATGHFFAGASERTASILRGRVHEKAPDIAAGASQGKPARWARRVVRPRTAITISAAYTSPI